jgi:hypothetical protein
MLLLQLRGSATTRWKTARWHTRLANKAQYCIALGPTRWVAHSTEVGSTNEERGRVRRSRPIRPAPQARSRVAFVVKPGGETRTLMTSPYGSQPLATVTTTTTINELGQSGATTRVPSISKAVYWEECLCAIEECYTSCPSSIV